MITIIFKKSLLSVGEKAIRKRVVFQEDKMVQRVVAGRSEKKRKDRIFGLCFGKDFKISKH